MCANTLGNKALSDSDAVANFVGADKDKDSIFFLNPCELTFMKRSIILQKVMAKSWKLREGFAYEYQTGKQRESAEIRVRTTGELGSP